MSMICDASPSLIKLAINFDAGGDMGDRLPFPIGVPSLLHPMRNLPFNDLYFRGASLGDYSSTIYGIIPTAWARITDLDMFDQ